MIEDKIHNTSEIVKKSNAIARAQWEPESVWEPRIVALVASKVRETDEDFQTYRIPVSELAGADCDNLRGNQYREIEKSIAHLGKAVIRIQGEKRNFRQYNIFAMCGYEDGHLIAGFHPDLKPHFLDLRVQFTAYDLLEYLSLPGTYSQRLFEILQSWSGTDFVEIALAELHEMLMTPPFMRDNFKDFRVRVLDKAKKDIDSTTSLVFEWEPIKQGKAVVAVRFIFAKDKYHTRLEERKKIEQEKQAKDNNAAFAAAVECAKLRAKEGGCKKAGYKKRICQLCVEQNILYGILRNTREKQGKLI